jgi:glucose/arabinose dehydrogenase
MYDKLGIGGIIRINTDGTGREVFTRGVRNSVGHDFNPANGDLWFTDNQTDGMGDDIPPGELNHQTEGRPALRLPVDWGRAVIDPRVQGCAAPRERRLRPAAVEMQAHAADLGMSFYKGSSFPERVPWRHLLGPARLVEPDDAGGRAGDVHRGGCGRQRRREPEVFADGWLNQETGEYRGTSDGHRVPA